MIVRIRNKNLEELLLTGKNRKLSIPPNVVEKFFAVYEIIEAATSIYDFRVFPSLHYKNLINEKNKVSFRLNSSYRLVAEMKWTNSEKTIAEVILLDINNHYE